MARRRRRRRAALLERAAAELAQRFRPGLRRVINAGGVILHTNLGRAPLAEAAVQAMAEVGAHYNTLEYDLERGARGGRLKHCEAALCALTGAEAALVVNNNAAALVLLLATLAQGREVIISRGQLIEIGGGFRVPEVMSSAGARLVEVGTTNRTRLADYERAIGPDTALLLRAHASNFRMTGFTEEAPLAQLVQLAHARGLLLVDDLGSGALLDTLQFGLLHEPTVAESMAAGADLVAFSGDKLTGGPQAGIIVGRAEPLDALKRHPLARALRADKLCLAGLAATLDLWRRGTALTQIPIWRMIAREAEELHAVAATWAQRLGGSVVAGRVGRGRRLAARRDTADLVVGAGCSATGRVSGAVARGGTAGHRAHRRWPRPAGPAHGAAGRGGRITGRAGRAAVAALKFWLRRGRKLRPCAPESPSGWRADSRS